MGQGNVSLTIDRTRIERNDGSGLRLLNGARLTMTGSVVAGNQGGGFDIDTDDGASETSVTVTDSSISQNSGRGFAVNSSIAGSIVRLTITRSMINWNSSGIFMLASTGTLTAVITDNAIVRNRSSDGIHVSGGGVTATIASNAISGNSPTGVFQLGGLLRTRANNIIRDNTADTSGILTFVAGD